jgi:hypothetical protein
VSVTLVEVSSADVISTTGTRLCSSLIISMTLTASDPAPLISAMT